jgi:hypothetical protein
VCRRAFSLTDVHFCSLAAVIKRPDWLAKTGALHNRLSQHAASLGGYAHPSGRAYPERVKRRVQCGFAMPDVRHIAYGDLGCLPRQEWLERPASHLTGPMATRTGRDGTKVAFAELER